MTHTHNDDAITSLLYHHITLITALLCTITSISLHRRLLPSHHSHYITLLYNHITLVTSLCCTITSLLLLHSLVPSHHSHSITLLDHHITQITSLSCTITSLSFHHSVPSHHLHHYTSLILFGFYPKQLTVSAFNHEDTIQKVQESCKSIQYIMSKRLEMVHYRNTRLSYFFYFLLFILF